jgi:hypothetical protein
MASIWVMLGYLSMGTIMFAEWEDWNYLDSAYFCVTSLLKVNNTLNFNQHVYLQFYAFLLANTK